ncbi:MAG: FKBP-type peptidyl-prolyl cis-trans isomerase [Nibricoccus sp.]
MKLKSTLITSLLVALGSASLCAQEVKYAGSPAAPAPQPASQFTEAQVVETLGWYYGKQGGFSEYGLTKEQIDVLVKGFRAAIEGKDAPFDPDKIGPEIGKFMQGKQQAYLNRLKDQGKAEGDKLFADLKNNKAVTVLPSGLAYEITKPGSGAYPKPTDRVKVFYTGTFVNGKTFDSNVGGEPIEFPLNGVIPGWSEGIQKINKGGKIKLYVPAKLGYGEEGNQSIPPNAALIFDVELLDVIDGSAPAATSTVPAEPKK